MIFLLTPLREGRLEPYDDVLFFDLISTHAPAGGATELTSEESASELFLLTPLREGRLVDAVNQLQNDLFLLTPLREGRPRHSGNRCSCSDYFYSRPCGRGDGIVA